MRFPYEKEIHVPLQDLIPQLGIPGPEMGMDGSMRYRESVPGAGEGKDGRCGGSEQVTPIYDSVVCGLQAVLSSRQH